MGLYTDSELRDMILEQDKRIFDGRLDRLRYLMSITPNNEVTPFPSLVLAYYEEARLCWYHGAYVAAIVMTQMAFEELIRSHYRSIGVKKLPLTGKPPDDANFVQLIKQAEQDGYLRENEVREIDKIRKDYRNRYVHVKDAKIINGKQDLKSSNWITVGMKAHGHNPLGADASDEAKETMRILISVLPDICRRNGGF